MSKNKELTKKAGERLLLELGSLPTAAGREDAVLALVRRWVSARPRLLLKRDPCGNLLVARADFEKACRRKAPLLITAHMDHPAFVVKSVKGRSVRLDFLGGVQDAYFKGAAIEIFSRDLTRACPARVLSLDAGAKPFKSVKASLSRVAPFVEPGCIGRWRFPAARVSKGLAHLPACDDLACLAAALLAYEEISADSSLAHAALLFTRAEEVGFVGAIGAARGGSIPEGARLVCLECSRSFPHDSPIGAGPIVRVGDRLSVFTPELTNVISEIAAAHKKARPAFRYQRKLMAGGACEATGFASYGLKSACLCLPLGNYHNMADPDGVLAGRKKARVAPEFISVADYRGLIELLCAVARGLDAPRPSARASMEKIWSERAGVLKA